MNELVITLTQDCSDDIKNAFMLFNAQQDVDKFYAMIYADGVELNIHMYSTSQESCLISCYMEHKITQIINQYDEFENMILISFRNKAVDSLLSIFNADQNNQVKLYIYEQNGIHYMKASCYRMLKGASKGDSAQYYIQQVSCPLDAVIVQPNSNRYLKSLGNLSNCLPVIKGFDGVKRWLGGIYAFTSQKNDLKLDGAFSDEQDIMLIRTIMKSFSNINNVPTIFSAQYKHPGQLHPAQSSRFIAQSFGPELTEKDYKEISECISITQDNNNQSTLLNWKQGSSGRIVIKSSGGSGGCTYAIGDARLRPGGSGWSIDDQKGQVSQSLIAGTALCKALGQARFAQISFESRFDSSVMKLMNWNGHSGDLSSCFILPENASKDVLSHLKAQKLCMADPPEGYFVMQRKLDSCYCQCRVQASALRLYLDLNNCSEDEIKGVLGQTGTLGNEQTNLHIESRERYIQPSNQSTEASIHQEYAPESQAYIPFPSARRPQIFQFNQADVKHRTSSLNSLEYRESDLAGSAIYQRPVQQHMQQNLEISQRQQLTQQQSYAQHVSQYSLEIPDLAGSSPINGDHDVLSLINSDTDDLNVEYDK